MEKVERVMYKAGVMLGAVTDFLIESAVGFVGLVFDLVFSIFSFFLGLLFGAISLALSLIFGDDDGYYCLNFREDGDDG
ncbi:MAG: hypothetical protein KAY24_00015 [Candidatus Eisenbacteria sp.]|nr:hypothetical protein [Candidatus Eisenbacteria bacterium]